MKMKLSQQLFAVKTIQVLEEELVSENRLRRVLGPVALTALGVGAIIGAGIFVLTGLAAHDYAGPALMLSFVLAGLGCAFAALCYAEFASMIPVAGSAYTYAYATLGELLAWIIGWDLILEYGMASSTVAYGWSKYFLHFIELFGLHVPPHLASDPFSTPGAWFNLPAAAIVLLVMMLSQPRVFFAMARDARASSWIPRASDAREVLQALEGRVRGNALGRVLSMRQIVPPLSDARRAHRTVPLLISPVQRWLLCAAPHHAADDYPD